MVRNLRLGPKHVPGVVVKRLAPYSYLVKVRDGMIVDHLHKLREATTEKGAIHRRQNQSKQRRRTPIYHLTIQQMKIYLNVQINTLKFKI